MSSLLRRAGLIVCGASAAGVFAYAVFRYRDAQHAFFKALLVSYASGTVGGGVSLFFYLCRRGRKDRGVLPRFSNSRNYMSHTWQTIKQSNTDNVVPDLANLATQLQQQFHDRALNQLPEDMQQSVLKVEGTLQRMDLAFRKCVEDSNIQPFKFNMLLNLAIEARLQIVQENNPSCVPHELGASVHPRLALKWMRYASCSYGFAFCKAMGLAEEVGLQEQLQRMLDHAGTTADIVEEVAKARTAADKWLIVQRTAVQSVGDVLLYSNDNLNKVEAPCFFVSVEHPREGGADGDEGGSVVLAIRGTASAADVLTDLVCESQDWGKEACSCEGTVHGGIARGALAVLRKCRRVLQKALRRWTGYKLVVTGHSLGGGTAILVTMLILQELQQQQRQSPRLSHEHEHEQWPSSLLSALRQRPLRPYHTHAHAPVQCWAYAPPPVFAANGRATAAATNAGADMQLYKDAIKSFVFRHDCVPRLSLHSVFGLLLRLHAIDKMESFGGVLERVQLGLSNSLGLDSLSSLGLGVQSRTDYSEEVRVLDARVREFYARVGTGKNAKEQTRAPAAGASSNSRAARAFVRSISVDLQSSSQPSMSAYTAADFGSFVPLQIPGRLWWIQEQDQICRDAETARTKMVLQEADQDDFRTILLKADMFVSHMPSSYESGLQALIAR